MYCSSFHFNILFYNFEVFAKNFFRISHIDSSLTNLLNDYKYRYQKHVQWMWERLKSQTNDKESLEQEWT